MRYSPHDYQQYAIRYIEEHPIAAILLDMGLGKTSITLTAVVDLLFDSFEVHKVLVIAPLRVARTTWSDEIQKWEHLNILRYAIAVGTEDERLSALKSKADIYIINRENVQWLIEKSGIAFDFDMVVVDELSSFKNWQSKRFKAFKRNGQNIYSYKPLPGAEDAIYQKISDITISMKSTDHLQMPELISTQYEVVLSEKEQEKYEEMKKDLVLQLPNGEITAANAASLTGKLSQMANGAVYGDDEKVLEIHEKKLDALEDIIEAANGKPILVAYWFKHDLERICRRLEELKVEYARISSPGSIEMWNRGEFAVGLIHPASAGHGLNLQSGGSHLIWFGLTWSLELYQQTNARLWRQGQTASTVVIQHLITKGTVDEQIMKALETKDASQSALISAVKANL